MPSTTNRTGQRRLQRNLPAQRIVVDTVRLPAFLASALVNGDESGLEDRDVRMLRAVEAWLHIRQMRVVETQGDAWFGHPQFPHNFTGDVIEYVVHVR